MEPDGRAHVALEFPVGSAEPGTATGDISAAFERACNTEFRRVYGYIRLCVGAPHVADDLTAQAFANAAQHLASYDPAKAPIEDWILSIARNVVRDHWRQQRRWRWLPLEWISRRAAEGPAPDQQILDDERADELLTAIRTLSPREREVLGMKFAGGLTNRAIARVLGLNENHVAVLVYRAVGRLRDRLDKERHHA